MALIKFYRGASGVTLPSFQDGAVFIVANNSQKDKISLGDMYVDVPGENQTGQRLHIVPNDAIYYKTQTDWEASQEWTETSVENRVYVKIVINGDNRTPYIAIGNGRTNVGLLTFKQLDATYAASNANPSEVQTTVWAGSSLDYARADHVHNITTATVTGLLGLTPSAAAEKGVVTAVTSASEDLPTSKAVDAAISSAVSSISSSIPSPANSTDTPAMDGTASVGVQVRWAHSDHVHPTDTSRAPKVHTANTPTYAGGGTSELYGHVKLSDAINSTSSAADSIAATPKAISSAVETLSASISGVSDSIPSVGTTAATAIATAASAGSTTSGTAYAAWNHTHNITAATITTALGYTPPRPDDIPSGAMRYQGTTTISITDGATTKPTDIYSGTDTPANGDVIISGEKEFVWNGSKWQEFGSTGSLKALAFKDNATASYQPAGTLNITLPTASKNVVSSVSTGTYVQSVTTAAQTIVTGVTTAAQTVATGGSATSITVSGEVLNIPASIITSVSTTSINKVTAVNTASKNVVSSVSTGTVVTAVTTASQTVVTGQPTTKTFTGTTATITVS